MTAAAQLATYFVGRSWDALPTPQIDQMKRLLLDYIGVAVSGSHADSGRIAGQFVEQMGGTPQATVIGSPIRVPAVNAAFANAIAEHSIELDDVDEEALFHYGPPVVSAALAVAQSRHATGREFLTALLAGCEMMSRLSLATNNALRNRGFHTTPTCGVFGATVASGLLLGLTAEQLTSALGLAGAQASGLMEMYGPSMQKRFNAGPAARNGVTAATMASLGFTGADTILEGERAFGRAFADGINLSALLDGLGSRIPVTVEFKPYSAARPIHNAVDCALEIRAGGGVAEDIVDIVVRRHPDWVEYHGNTAPLTFHEAQMSLPYSVAAAFVFGSALPEQYRDENLDSPELRRISAAVRIESDPSLVRGVSCDMTVIFRDGSTARSTVDYPKGSVQNPLSQLELEAKFRSLTDGLLDPDAASDVVSMVAAIESLSDVDELFVALERMKDLG